MQVFNAHILFTRFHENHCKIKPQKFASAITLCLSNHICIALITKIHPVLDQDANELL